MVARVLGLNPDDGTSSAAQKRQSEGRSPQALDSTLQALALSVNGSKVVSGKMTLRQPVHQSGQGLHQVVIDDHDGEQHQENKRRLVDAFFDAQADVAPHEAFDEEEQDDAAIENGNGQQVKDAEVEANPGRQFEQ